MRGAAALQIRVIPASNCISQPEQLHWIFFPSFYLNKVIIFTFFVKELQLHTIKCRIAKLNPNKQQQEYPASFPKCSLTLRKMNKVLILPLFRYVVNWFHFFLFPALLFLFQWGWGERTQILIHCQKVLVIERSVDEGFCHVVMSPSPTVTEGSVQTWSHTAHPFVLWTARSLFTHWNSLPVFPVRWSEMLRSFSPPSFALPFLPGLVSHPPADSWGVRGAHKHRPGAGELGQGLPSAAEPPWS